MRILSLVLFLCLVGLPALAGKDYCKELSDTYKFDRPFRMASKQEAASIYEAIPVFLTYKGVTPVGWVDFTQVAEEIKSIRVCFNDSPRPLIGSGSRSGAVNFKKEKIIVLNIHTSVRFDEGAEWALLFLHEVLGALGYPDENYQLTSYIYARIQAPHFGSIVGDTMEKGLNETLKNQSRRLDNPLNIDFRGVTGVGDGGDPQIAIIKPAMIALLLNNPEFFASNCGGVNNVAAVANYILNMRLETNDTSIFPVVTKVNGDMAIVMDQNRQFFIQINHQTWPTLRRLGEAGLQDRSAFIQNLVQVSCILQKNLK